MGHKTLGIVILILLLLIITLMWEGSAEHYIGRAMTTYYGPSYLSVPSSYPIGYVPPSHDVYRIRRWRSAVPAYVARDAGVVSRQVSDDEWDRTYNSGLGFQLA